MTSEPRPDGPPATGPVVAPVASTPHRWPAMTVGLLLLIAVAAATALATPGSGTAPPAVTDLAAEDATIAVLGIYAAELQLGRTARDPADIFALPGPLARADAIDVAASAVTAAVEEARFAPISPGSVAATYVLHPDHTAIASQGRQLAVHARSLALLRDVHDTLFGGAGATIDLVVRGQLEQIAANQVAVAAGRWASTLLAALDGAADPDAAATALVAAAQEYVEGAGRVGPVAGDQLVAYLNGVDPAVLTVLDGHPLAGPALQTLR